MRDRTTTLCVLLLVVAALVPAGVAGASGADGPAETYESRSAGVAASVQNGSAGDCGFPYSATDASGTNVTLERQPERVTTLNPSAAQTIWEIGGKAQVVGVTKYAAYLDGAESKTNVSASGFGVSTEKVVGTEPDLVLAPNTTDAETVNKLREAGLTVYLFSMATSIDDVAQKTTTIGELTGNCEEAARTNAWMRQNVEAARNATEGTDRPKAMYPLGGGYVVGGGTFISAMIEASGGTNVVAEAGHKGYPQLNDETVLELAPEVFVATGENRFVLSSEPYASTPAGENNETVSVDANYLNQPAPRSVVYATRNLTEGFHPDAAANAAFIAKSEVSLRTDTPTDEETSGDGSTATETGTGLPGFGLGAALAALVAGTLALFVRR